MLCLGDIALTGNAHSSTIWPDQKPADLGCDGRILFNWEAPLGKTARSEPRKCGGPRLIAYLPAVEGIRSWSPGFAALANNHILDADEIGLQNTLFSLQINGFEPFGAGFTRPEIDKPVLRETNDGSLAILNWVFPETHPDWMAIPGPNCWPGAETAGKVIGELKKKADWVMVFAHWSDELFPYPRPEDRALAMELSSCGADLVVGHHPHVVRGMEVIGSCPVFYSLGNCYFSSDVTSSRSGVSDLAPRNREALGILLTFEREREILWTPIPYWQKGNRVMVDRLHRASRRLIQTSRPLRLDANNDYAKWYASERSLFDKFWAKWHFGVMQLGFWGSIRRISEKLF